MRCPHCGFQQREAVFAIGTVCRRCQESFAIDPVERADSSLSVFERLRKARAESREWWRHRLSDLSKWWSEATGKTKAKRIQYLPDPSGRARRKERQAVSCFDCGRVHKVISNATSTICPGCGTYIDLRDVEINERGHQRVRTRGKVIVAPKAVLTTPGIHCGDLHVYGQVMGSIHASGEVKFFSDGKVLGELRCRRLYVERWTKLHFLQPIYAQQVDIHGEVHADICCEGLLSLSKNGVIHGHVLSAKMKAPGGVNINGQMCILSKANLDYIRSNPSFAKLSQMFDLEKISSRLNDPSTNTR